jgi:hypothetical protein
LPSVQISPDPIAEGEKVRNQNASGNAGGGYRFDQFLLSRLSKALLSRNPQLKALPRALPTSKNEACATVDEKMAEREGFEPSVPFWGTHA